MVELLMKNMWEKKMWEKKKMVELCISKIQSSKKTLLEKVL